MEYVEEKRMCVLEINKYASILAAVIEENPTSTRRSLQEMIAHDLIAYPLPAASVQPKASSS
jgi:hypothetical protein